MQIDRLREKRKAFESKIRENPTDITLSRKAMADDGFGGQVEDPFGAVTQIVLTVRIFRKRGIAVDLKGSPNGFSTSLERALQTKHDAIVYEGETFSALGKSFVVGPVDPIVAFGGIVGYQADLKEAATVPGGDDGGYT